MKRVHPDSHAARPAPGQRDAVSAAEAAAPAATELEARCAELERENARLQHVAEQLARERDSYAERYDGLPVACLTLETDGTVVEGNAVFTALLGPEERSASRLNLEALIAVPQHVQRFRDLLATTLRAPGLRACELWLRRPDGGVMRARIECAATPGVAREGRALCRGLIAEVNAPGAVVRSSDYPGPISAAPAPRRESGVSAPPAAVSEQPAPQVRGTVLVIEDESLVRKAVQHYLTVAGYRVLTAVDRGNALERAEHHDGPIDLILADLSLPNGATGPEIVAEIHARRPQAAVIYMTACPPDLLARRGIQLPGGGRTLEKPFSKDALLARVAEALAADPPAHRAGKQG